MISSPIQEIPSKAVKRTIGSRVRAGLISVALFVGVFSVIVVTLTVIRSKPTLDSTPAESASLEIGDGTLTGSINALQRRLARLPGDWQAWAGLGAAYVQQARVTADPTYYPRAQGALEQSLRIEEKNNYQALVGMSSLAAARHDFAAALRFGMRAERINTYNAGVHAVLGDALVELGRYPEAFAQLQRMVNLRPGFSAYSRISYTWELQGNIANAIASLQLALQSAGSAADSAYASYYLGELYWNRGNLKKAESYYKDGLRFDSSFVRNRAGLAKIAAARKQYATAVSGYKAVTDVFPLPEYVIALGDVYAAMGRKDLAQNQYDLVAVQRKLFQSNGVNVDGEIALFTADHKVNLTEGLRAAREEWSKRHSVETADTLAWQLYANGSFAEALAFSNQALRLGTRSALFHFHRGMIEKQLGDLGPARRDLAAALSTNPSFSIRWSAVAAAAYRSLRGAA